MFCQQSRQIFIIKPDRVDVETVITESCQLKPPVPRDDAGVGVHENGVIETKSYDARSDLGDLGFLA